MRRNTLRRRLRAILAARLPQFPAGTAVVVRALPGAAELDSRELSALVDSALGELRPC